MEGNFETEQETTSAHTHLGKLLRYTLGLFVTGFIYREVVYMAETPYPGWLFIVLLAGIVLLVFPYESLGNDTA